MKQNLLLLLLLVLPVVGCGKAGPPTYPVTGTVTHQGKPLPLGMVMFVAAEGPPSRPAPIDSNGNYRLEAVAGSHAVQIIAIPPRRESPDPSVDGGGDYADFPEVQSLIPEKYNRYHTSGITVVVEAKDRNEIAIRLE